MRNEVIKNEVMINEVNLPVKECNGKIMVTFKDIDMVHDRPEGTAARNFKTNKKHFIEGVDFYICKKSDFLKDGFRPLGIEADNIPNRGLTLISESGYLMVVKSFTDDKSWKVQRDLVNTYFKFKEVSHRLSEELPIDTQALYQAVLDMNKNFQTMCNQISNIENDFNLQFEEFKKVMSQIGCLSLKTKKETPLIVNTTSSDPIRDTIKPLAELYNDKSVGFNNTYRKVYAAMEVDWRRRKTRYKNVNGNKNKPSKFKLMEQDKKLLSLFSDTVNQLLQDFTEVNINE